MDLWFQIPEQRPEQPPTEEQEQLPQLERVSYTLPEKPRRRFSASSSGDLSAAEASAFFLEKCARFAQLNYLQREREREGGERKSRERERERVRRRRKGELCEALRLFAGWTFPGFIFILIEKNSLNYFVEKKIVLLFIIKFRFM